MTKAKKNYNNVLFAILNWLDVRQKGAIRFTNGDLELVFSAGANNGWQEVKEKYLEEKNYRGVQKVGLFADFAFDAPNYPIIPLVFALFPDLQSLGLHFNIDNHVMQALLNHPRSSSLHLQILVEIVSGCDTDLLHRFFSTFGERISFTYLNSLETLLLLKQYCPHMEELPMVISNLTENGNEMWDILLQFSDMKSLWNLERILHLHLPSDDFVYTLPDQFRADSLAKHFPCLETIHMTLCCTNFSRFEGVATLLTHCQQVKHIRFYGVEWERIAPEQYAKEYSCNLLTNSSLLDSNGSGSYSKLYFETSIEGQEYASLTKMMRTVPPICDLAFLISEWVDACDYMILMNGIDLMLGKHFSTLRRLKFHLDLIGQLDPLITALGDVQINQVSALDVCGKDFKCCVYYFRHVLSLFAASCPMISSLGLDVPTLVVGDKDMEAILQAFPHLNALDMRGLGALTDDLLASMAKTGRVWESVKVKGSEKITLLSFMKAIKEQGMKMKFCEVMKEGQAYSETLGLGKTIIASGAK